ncbi:MAG: hypothetical protein J3R72DRAFT_529231 [Linnemannia gamsii]|nr:MAG: hypothetical protein J3R72DRAFT_529231 [Linnemannia gamsii]
MSTRTIAVLNMAIDASSAYTCTVNYRATTSVDPLCLLESAKARNSTPKTFITTGPLVTSRADLMAPLLLPSPQQRQQPTRPLAAAVLIVILNQATSGSYKAEMITCNIATNFANVHTGPSPQSALAGRV